MRGRIRQLKPDIFLDDEFWELTQQHPSLPLLQGWLGLWCQADREGRFEWRAAVLKTQILPYWSGDFGAILDVLCGAGLVLCYQVGGRRYGVIRSFLKHQRPNNREPASCIPQPLEHAQGADSSPHESAEAPRASQPQPQLPTPNSQLPTPTREAEPPCAPEHITEIRTVKARAAAHEPPVVPAQYRQYPKGWRWSAETESEALMQAVSRDDLQEHVTFWTTHLWTVPVTDLDGELRRKIPDIRARRETNQAKARAGPRAAGDRIRNLIERANAMGEDE